MDTIIVILFLLGYLAIALEHNLKIDKIVPALGMMAILWAIVSVSGMPLFEVNSELRELEPAHLEGLLLHHLGKTSEILMFLIGAMTIVEIIDYFDGFATIKSFVKTKNRKKLLFLFTFLAFVLSAIIDNLTATIVLITILQKIVKLKEIKFWYAGIIIIAANAGGAWSPIGDVTTTMLWIAGKVTPASLIEHTLLPSMVCALVPTLIASRFKIFQGDIEGFKLVDGPKSKYSQQALILGLSGIIFVPIFKTLTHLPPYIGMALSLSLMCIFAEVASKRHFSLMSINDDEANKKSFVHPIHHSLSSIEFSSILFFFGILMAVAALESLGHLFNLAEILNHAIPNKHVVIMILGGLSAVVDNVPLVAAGMGMFSEPADHTLWHSLAYSAGTGGSMLIIGSAAGVIAMGMEKINFVEYLKKISFLALIGFLSGYILMITLF